MSSATAFAPRESLQRELDTAKRFYLEPSSIRTVDSKFLEMIADFIIPKVQGERILELGEGFQVWTPKLLARFPCVTSVDGSLELLEAMHRHLAGTPYLNRWTPVHAFFEDYVPAERYDAIIATYVLEHVDDPALILRRAQSMWLKPGGLLVVAVPHALSLHRRVAVKMGIASRPDELGETDRRLGHKNCFTHLEMRALIERAGFEVCEQFGMITKALPNSLLSHCSDAQLRGLFEAGLELPIEYAGAIGFVARSTGALDTVRGCLPSAA